MSSLYEEYKDKLYGLELMETKDIADFKVTRVPDGWIFKSITMPCITNGSESMVFVPDLR